MTENQTALQRRDRATHAQSDQTMPSRPDQGAQLPEENTQGRAAGRLGIMVQVGLLAGPFMSMIDSSAVNVALPDMAAGMHSSLSAVQWVASAYLLALGMALTGTAYLARRFGTKRVYLASLVGFTAASALCAISPGLWTLMAARVAQGIFGAPLVPLAMNMLMGKGAGKQISAAAGMILFLAPALGPSLGGVLIDWAGWPMIFLINIPVGILAVIGGKRLPGALTGEKQDAAHFDALGFGLLAGGMAGVTFGASRGTQAGWLSWSAWPYWAVGAVLLASYAVWARHREHPIVDLSLVWRPRQALALALTVLVSVVTFAVIVLVPAFMQEIQGHSAVAAGMALLPQGFVTGVGTVLGNRLPIRWGVRRTAVSGMALLTLSTAGLLAVTATSPAWLVAVILCGRGFAIGLVIQPLLNGLIQSLPESRVPDGTALFNVAQRISGTLGIALIVTFFQVREHWHVQREIKHLGVPVVLTHSNAAAGVSKLPAFVQHRLADAAAAGFHDVIGLVAGMSALGVLMALFVGNDAVLTREAG